MIDQNLVGEYSTRFFYDGRAIDFVFILSVVVIVVVISVLIEEVRRYLFGSFEKVCIAKVESIFNLDKK